MEYLYFIGDFVGEYIVEFILFLYIGFLILIIASLISNHKNKKLLEKYNLLVRNFNGENLEQLIIYLQNHINELNGNLNSARLDIEEIGRKLDFAMQKTGFIRYNAFDDMGSELSYSIALLDSFENGFILTSIYGRDHNINYAKDIKNGESKSKLSAEEIIALERALKSNVEKV